MEHDVIERLRAARPRVDEDAFDPALLARVQAQPIDARRRLPRTVAIPVAAGVTLTATAVVMLGGGPGEVGGPSSASAITQALHWLQPAPDQILHARSIETQSGRTTTREVWQSSDDPNDARLRVEEATLAYETVGDALYDPATNTIYDAAADEGEKPRKEPGLKSGDPIVGKVRYLLEHGQMAVTGPANHDGTEAWAISLKPDEGRPSWTVWVSAANGKPLELRDPGRDANEAPQTIRWPTYEVVPEAGAQQLLTLTGAHPSARVDHDPAAAAAARQRLGVDGPKG